MLGYCFLEITNAAVWAIFAIHARDGGECPAYVDACALGLRVYADANAYDVCPWPDVHGDGARPHDRGCAHVQLQNGCASEDVLR